MAHPQARREVIGQILNYASELSRWTYEDLQRVLAARLGTSGNVLFELVRAQHPDADEQTFCDNVARSLRLGQFLLLVVGDGIQEGARQIADFLVDKSSSLGFHLGMVDIQAYDIAGVGRLLMPHVQVRTEVIRRWALLAGSAEDVAESDEGTEEEGPQRDEAAAEQRRARARQFWSEVLGGLTLDDQTQLLPKPGRGGNLVFPSPPDIEAAIKAWFAIYNNDRAGVYLKFGHSAEDLAQFRALEQEQGSLAEEVGAPLEFSTARGAPYIAVSRSFNDVTGADRKAAQDYLRASINRFVNVFRHRIKRWYDNRHGT